MEKKKPHDTANEVVEFSHSFHIGCGTKKLEQGSPRLDSRPSMEKDKVNDRGLNFLIGKEEVRGYLDKPEVLKLAGQDIHPRLMKSQGC